MLANPLQHLYAFREANIFQSPPGLKEEKGIKCEGRKWRRKRNSFSCLSWSSQRLNPCPGKTACGVETWKMIGNTMPGLIYCQDDTLYFYQQKRNAGHYSSHGGSITGSGSRDFIMLTFFKSTWVVIGCITPVYPTCNDLPYVFLTGEFRLCHEIQCLQYVWSINISICRKKATVFKNKWMNVFSKECLINLGVFLV